MRKFFTVHLLRTSCFSWIAQMIEGELQNIVKFVGTHIEVKTSVFSIQQYLHLLIMDCYKFCIKAQPNTVVYYTHLQHVFKGQE